MSHVYHVTLIGRALEYLEHLRSSTDAASAGIQRLYIEHTNFRFTDLEDVMCPSQGSGHTNHAANSYSGDFCDTKTC